MGNWLGGDVDLSQTGDGVWGRQVDGDAGGDDRPDPGPHRFLHRMHPGIGDWALFAAAQGPTVHPFRPVSERRGTPVDSGSSSDRGTVERLFGSVSKLNPRVIPGPPEVGCKAFLSLGCGGILHDSSRGNEGDVEVSLGGRQATSGPI